MPGQYDDPPILERSEKVRKLTIHNDSGTSDTRLEDEAWGNTHILPFW
jgi:hypothetical protein